MNRIWTKFDLRRDIGTFEEKINFTISQNFLLWATFLKTSIDILSNTAAVCYIIFFHIWNIIFQYHPFNISLSRKTFHGFSKDFFVELEENLMEQNGAVLLILQSYNSWWEFLFLDSSYPLLAVYFSCQFYSREFFQITMKWHF